MGVLNHNNPGCPKPTEIYLDVNTHHKYFQVSETHHRLELQLDDVSMSESPESEQAARGGDQHHHHHHCHRHSFHHNQSHPYVRSKAITSGNPRL